MTWRHWAFLIVLCSTAFLGSLFAQSPNASISGRVADQSGAAVRDAKIAATNIAINRTSTTETNGAGFYNLVGLIPGTYRLTVEKEGFAQVVKPDLVLHVQDSAGVNFALQVVQLRRA
jgi:carboxypeptidase family protein